MTITFTPFTEALDQTTQSVLTSQARSLLVNRQAPAHLWLAPEQAEPLKQAQFKARALAGQVLDKLVRELISVVGRSDRFLSSLTLMSNPFDDAKTPMLARLTGTRLQDALRESQDLVTYSTQLKADAMALASEVNQLAATVRGHNDTRIVALRAEIDALQLRLREINARQMEILLAAGVTLGEWVTTAVKILPSRKAGQPASDQPIVTLERIEADAGNLVKGHAEFETLREEADRVFRDMATAYLRLYEHEGSTVIIIAFADAIADLGAALGRSENGAIQLLETLGYVQSGWGEAALEELGHATDALKQPIAHVSELRKQISGQNGLVRTGKTETLSVEG